MQYTYHEPNTGGTLNLLCQEATFGRQFSQEHQNRLLTIAWNRCNHQTVTIDGIDHCFPAQTVLPLMINQTVTFQRPADIVAWQFDRVFYCIADHDKEVSCVGFLFYGAKDPMFLRLDDSEQPKFNALLTVFFDEFLTHDTIQGEMLRMLLKRLIIKLTRLAKDQYLDQKLSEKDLSIVRRFNLLVEIHYRQLHAVRDYADLLNKSPKTLSNLFALYNQKSPLQLIHERITLEAKRLLLYTDKSTKEVAYELGFEEVPHFSRFFKKQVNIPPSEFKEQIEHNLTANSSVGKN